MNKVEHKSNNLSRITCDSFDSYRVHLHRLQIMDAISTKRIIVTANPYELFIVFNSINVKELYEA